MAPDRLTWTLSVPSDCRLLSIVRAFLEAVCQVGGFSPAGCSAVVLATHEAVSNVIRHGHHDNAEATVHLHCSLASGRLEIVIEDEAEPFDLEAVPALDPGELRIGGRGVFLMRTLMDEVSCSPRAQRGNCLRMVKHCDRPLPARDAG